jgi:hypothetical protein
MADRGSEKERAPAHPLRWFPEFWELSHRRIRPQARLFGLSLLVGVISGVGAIVFFVACQVVYDFALDTLAGYRPEPPGGEPQLFADTATRAARRPRCGSFPARLFLPDIVPQARFVAARGE